MIGREESESQKLTKLGLAHANALLSNPSFQWFIEQAIGAQMTALDVILHDPKKDSAERDKALERWDELDKARNWTKEHLRMCQTNLGQKVTTD